MNEQTADAKKIEVGSIEWLESYREPLARITGAKNYVDVLIATCRALQPVKKENK